MRAHDLARGTLVVHYRVEAVLGRGGVGVVYLADDLRLKRRVALKVLSPSLAEDERFRERFLSESELAASLDHGNVIPVYEAGEADGSLFIAMRYVEGSDLKSLLGEGPLSEAQVVALADQIGGALDAAHERGLVHGDVKPSNVLIDGRGHAYLADFGLTKRVGSKRTSEGEAQLMGTIEYVAPELIRGEEVDGRADVYSLGCLLYECLTGRQPFKRGNDAAVLYAHLEDEPPAIGTPVDRVLARALAKSPGERYQTCAELVHDARVALGVAAPRRSRLPIAIAAVAVLVAAAALTAFFLFRGSSGPSTLTGRLLRIDPTSNRVQASIRVGGDPSAIVAGNGAVWVASRASEDVWRLNARTGNVVRFTASGTPHALALSGTVLYVADEDGTVKKIDTGSGSIAGGSIETGAPNVIASGSAGVWAANAGAAARFAADSPYGPGKLLAFVRLPDPVPLDETDFRGETTGVAVGKSGVWVSGDAFDRRLWRIDPRTARIVATIELPFAPRSVTEGLGAVWVTAQLDDTVAEIDPATNRIARTIHVGREPTAVATGARAVWVANTIDSTVSRIDPATGRVTATIPVAASPTAIIVSGSSVWVAGDEE